MCGWEYQIQHKKGHVRCNADIIVSCYTSCSEEWWDESEFTELKSEWEWKMEQWLERALSREEESKVKTRIDIESKKVLCCFFAVAVCFLICGFFLFDMSKNWVHLLLKEEIIGQGKRYRKKWCNGKEDGSGWDEEHREGAVFEQEWSCLSLVSLGGWKSEDRCRFSAWQSVEKGWQRL